MLPQGIAHTEVGECGRNNHQHWDDFFGSPVLQPDQADLYELRAKADPQHVFHPDYPPQLRWNFEGKTQTGAPYPNPTFLHGMGVPSLYACITSYHKIILDSVHRRSVCICTVCIHYPKAMASLVIISARSNPGSLWLHRDTSWIISIPMYMQGLRNLVVSAIVVKHWGPCGITIILWILRHPMPAGVWLVFICLLFDDLDSGDEHDSNPAALRLPSHPYDYPLLFQDKRFDAGGIQIFNQLDPEGALGDKITVNGKIEPVLRVARRKYRIRLLNAGPSRFYEFYLVNSANVVQKFTHISNDGNHACRTTCRACDNTFQPRCK